MVSREAFASESGRRDYALPAVFLNYAVNYTASREYPKVFNKHAYAFVYAPRKFPLPPSPPRRFSHSFFLSLSLSLFRRSAIDPEKSCEPKRGNARACMYVCMYVRVCVCVQRPMIARRKNTARREDSARYFMNHGTPRGHCTASSPSIIRVNHLPTGTYRERI